MPPLDRTPSGTDSASAQQDTCFDEMRSRLVRSSPSVPLAASLGAETLDAQTDAVFAIDAVTGAILAPGMSWGEIP